MTGGGRAGGCGSVEKRNINLSYLLASKVSPKYANFRPRLVSPT
jgi:hypothetical protein